MPKIMDTIWNHIWEFRRWYCSNGVKLHVRNNHAVRPLPVKKLPSLSRDGSPTSTSNHQHRHRRQGRSHSQSCGETDGAGGALRVVGKGNQLGYACVTEDISPAAYPELPFSYRVDRSMSCVTRRIFSYSPLYFRLSMTYPHACRLCHRARMVIIRRFLKSVRAAHQIASHEFQEMR